MDFGLYTGENADITVDLACMHHIIHDVHIPSTATIAHTAILRMEKCCERVQI